MLFLAPLHGYTDYVFRNAYAKHFKGIDYAITPFVSLVIGKRVKHAHLRDVLPENNHGMKLIPQVLGTDPDQFIIMAEDLHKLGYESVNWNLGCPIRAIARKKRGSGLLPYPDLIREILERILPQLPVKLSIKTRLGYEAVCEIDKLMPVYNSFPLEYLIIHPRIGTQMYEGRVNLKKFRSCLSVSTNPVIYNGDIYDVEKFEELKKQFASVQGWMLGRGALENLFLPEMIRGQFHYPTQEIREKIICFHHDLMSGLENRMKREKNVLNKSKEYWGHFQKMFCRGDEIFDELKITQSVKEYRRKADWILENDILIY